LGRYGSLASSDNKLTDLPKTHRWAGFDPHH
jgi:hypothetical protein